MDGWRRERQPGDPKLGVPFEPLRLRVGVAERTSMIHGQKPIRKSPEADGVRYALSPRRMQSLAQRGWQTGCEVLRET